MAPILPTLRLVSQPHFLSEADGHAIAQRIQQASIGGGSADVHIVSRWRGSLRWARNRVTTGGDDQDNRITVWRTVQGARSGQVTIDDVSADAVVAAVRRAEQLARHEREFVEVDAGSRADSPFAFHDEPVTKPQLFFDSTYQLDSEQRAAAAERLMREARAAGMLSAGYIEVSAISMAYLTSWGFSHFFQYTWARYKTTVRDPTGLGSGWAGVDWPDWNKIDGERLSAIALEKCLKSRNPVAVEPGRYTTILEPQAVCDLLAPWSGCVAPRDATEMNQDGVWHKGWKNEQEPPFEMSDEVRALGLAKFGERVIDERLTFRTDPLDPAVAFAPYQLGAYVPWTTGIYHPVTWIERGVLKNLEENSYYSIRSLGRETQQVAPGSFRLSVDGPTSTVEEMIQTTERGLLVTRFDQVLTGSDNNIRQVRGYTRDGLWLIEHGKISKPAVNMVFVEYTLAVLNRVEQVGVPQRCYHPGVVGFPELVGDLAWLANPQPVMTPALKIRDFSFTALSNAI